MLTPHRADAVTIAAAVRAGAVSARAVVEDHLAAIAAHDPGLNCFTAVTAARALADADAVDARIAAGDDPGPLAGVPVAVKNLYDIAGVVTLAGSKILRDAPPADADAMVLARLVAAGAVLVGALNMDEFAYGFTTINAHYGVTRNPHDPLRIAGGSSGGSAAAVAAGFAAITLGSDTNGSIRVPAALCGVFGLKPTYGALSRAGTFPFVDSLDHVGSFARSVADLAISFDVMHGTADTRAMLDDARPMRIAVLDGWFAERCSIEARGVVLEAAAALGATDHAILPEAERARAAAFCITAAEGGALHAARLRARAAEFDPATRHRLLAGALLPASIVQAAQRFRTWFAAQADALFSRYDAVLAPVSSIPAPLIDQPTMVLDGVAMPVRATLGLFTQPISFIGLPVVVAPIPAPDRLPLGVQIITRPGAEATGLMIARRLEQAGIAAAPLAAGAFAH